MGTIFPPALLGHDEQDLLKASGLPAAAWVHATRVVSAPTRDDPDGAKLQVRFGDAPASVCKLINRKAYRKTSAEIYDEPPGECANVPGVKGKVLRAVALLGSEIPKVKRLEDIPQFNEETGQSTGWVDVFATGKYDGQVYTRQHLNEMSNNYGLLVKAGVDTSKYSEKTPVIGAFRRVFMEAAPRSQPMDELRQKMIAAGMPEAVVTAMDDSELQAFAAACAAASAPATPAPGTGGADMAAGEGGPAMEEDKSKTPAPSVGAATAPADDTVVAKYSDAITKRVLQALSASGVANVDRIKEIDATIARRLFSEKVKGLLDSGKLAPSVNQGGLIEAIGVALATGTKVAKFSDKEQSTESMFGLLIDRLAGQKPVSVVESHPSGDPKNFSETQKEAEVAKVKGNYQRFSERFEKLGTSEETYVNAFKLLAERGTTADEYIGR